MSPILSHRERIRRHLLGQHTSTKWPGVINRPSAAPPITTTMEFPGGFRPSAPPAAQRAIAASVESYDFGVSHDADPNVNVLDGGSSETLATDNSRWVLAESSWTSAPSHMPDRCVTVLRDNEDSEPEWQASNDKGVDEGLPVLTHVNPKQGPTSGGNEIYLLVQNILPTAVLYARFGPNIAATSYIAPGILSCRLPAAAQPGVVDITLCHAPSVHEKTYGKSLVSFEYEREPDNLKVVDLLLDLLDGTSHKDHGLVGCLD